MRTIRYLLIGCVLLNGCKEQQNKKSLQDSEIKLASETPTALENKTQTSDIMISPIEHATMVLEWNDLTIYVDPVGGAPAFEAQKQPDLILITDIHGDHFSLETLEALDTSKAKIIVPQAVADLIPEPYTPQLDILDNGDVPKSVSVSRSKLSPCTICARKHLNFMKKVEGTDTY